MDLNFRPVEAEDMSRLRPFYGLRPNRTCDSVFLDSFLWKDYYKVECAVSEDKAVLWLMEKMAYFQAPCLFARKKIFHISSIRW